MKSLIHLSDFFLEGFGCGVRLVLQYYVNFPAATGQKFIKRVSDYPKRLVKHNYAFGNQCTGKQLR